jgi:hypothetical protein
LNFLLETLEPTFVVDEGGLSDVVRKTWKLEEDQLDGLKGVILCSSYSEIWEAETEQAEFVGVLQVDSQSGNFAFQNSLVMAVLTIASTTSGRLFTKFGSPWDTRLIALGNIPWITPRYVLVVDNSAKSSSNVHGLDFLFDSDKYQQFSEEWLNEPAILLSQLKIDMELFLLEHGEPLTSGLAFQQNLTGPAWLNSFKPKNR